MTILPPSLNTLLNFVKIDVLTHDMYKHVNKEDKNCDNQEPDERIMKAIEDAHNNMAEYVDQKFQGLETFIFENPNVTVHRGLAAAGNHWDLHITGFSHSDKVVKHISGGDREEKREKALRRQSVFGTREPISPLGNERKQGPYWPDTVTTIQLVTRSSFPDIELKFLSSVEHICYFLDQYQNTVCQHQNHKLRMIQFCAKTTYPDLTVAAKRLRFISTNIFTGGLMMLTDEQLQQCIYEHVKAKSPQDYIEKIKKVKFRVPGKEDGFHPDASNIPELLNAATYFTHMFRRTTELITETCDPDFIPPLYKEGKTLGLIDYYLNAWPNDSGNILYSRLSVITPALRVAKSLQEFTDLFLEKIEPYTRLKQQYDDVNSMLSRRSEKHDRVQDGPKSSGTPKHNSRFADKHKHRQILKRGSMHMLADDDGDDCEAENMDDTILQMSQHDFGGEDDEEEVVFDEADEAPRVEEVLEQDGLNAMNTPNSGAVKGEIYPCWFKFSKGECTKDGCRLDHSERAMQMLRDKKIRELALSRWAPKPQELLPAFNRYANQKPMDGGIEGHKKA